MAFIPTLDPIHQEMTNETTAARDAIASLTDPETYRDRDDVEYVEDTMDHADEDHCGSDVDGRAIVGVTTDDGALLVLEHDEDGVSLLPNEPVEPGGDWAIAARRVLGEKLGVDVKLDGVELVRKCDHRVDGHDGVQRTGHHVVFRASPTESTNGDPEEPDDLCEFTLTWTDELPENDVETDSPIEDDLRLFLD